MSQKWAYDGILVLAQSSRQSLLSNIKVYPWGGVYDNLHVRFLAYEQRLDNQNHFDCGTAATILINQDPHTTPPDPNARRQQLLVGRKSSITLSEILELESAASPRLRTWAIHYVLKLLIDAPDFDFSTYKYKESELFVPPPPVFQLATGREHATRQYMLDTMHLDESFYEGNDRVLTDIWRQLKFDTPEKQRSLGSSVIPWVGDQLTIARIRGLQTLRYAELNSFDRLEHIEKQPGWLHILMAFEHSLHAQYFSTRASLGLIHAVELLNRKGLHSPSVQGTFHHHIQELLSHVAEARFRDIWCILGSVSSLADLRHQHPEQLHTLATRIIDEFASTPALWDLQSKPKAKQDQLLQQGVRFNRDILDYLNLTDAITSGDVGRMEDLLPCLLFRFSGGKNYKYTGEVLEMLQSLHREWPADLKAYMLKHSWLANTTGLPGRFLPIDMLQEHNVLGIKHTFATSGPYMSWDYIGKTSASIPTQRKVIDHVEADINHFRRGKSHTSPSKEADINKLQQSYQASKLHQHLDVWLKDV
ncbi:hypothetical protein CERSUDRAFT_95685 [Gelatoporia subvermispora B]|uniref:DUF6589 domain-containing protein n=1 Tax=Ceriporiopsis subvermispora (strain B) TaxID=914234 RepID=M2RD60_CERS8|nr:hypothetical protein CERSUDRAFT_95685 [Gelatoporia subvermispora B]